MGLLRLCDAHRRKPWDEGRLAGWKAAAQLLARENRAIVYAMFEPGKFQMLRHGGQFVYFDNPYFRREEKHRRFRLIRGATHLTHILPEQAGREIDVPPLEPWRMDGEDVIIIPPSQQQCKIYSVDRWAEDRARQLREFTKRKIVVKHDKGYPLAKLLPKAWAVMTFASVAGVEAAIAGVPVFSTDRCPSWPISAGALKDIEYPSLKDRKPWLRSLGYACWTMDDLADLDLDNYNYARSDDRIEIGTS